MAKRMGGFLHEDNGQDLIEYSLLITFIAIACMALLGAGRPAVNAIWNNGKTQLSNAATAATS
jgi:Flp pilus assembly pilin Flp